MLTYKAWLSEKQYSDIILYHGYPSWDKPFDKFKTEIAFFADKKQFAIDYGEQKAFEQSTYNDAPIYLAKCSFSGKLFYPWNINERQLLYNNLPDKIKVNYSIFDADLDKDIVISGIRGVGEKEIIGDAVGKEIGQTFKRDNEKFIIVDKDDRSVWTISQSYFNDIIKSVLMIFHPSSPPYDSYTYKGLIGKYFEPLMDKIFKYAKDEKKIKFNLINHWNYELNDEQRKEIRNDAEKILMKLLKENKEERGLRIYKYNIGKSKVALRDTWNYLENDTVINILKKLGYDGYVAKERKYYTYAIFNPKDKVKIIETEKIRS